MNNRLFAILIVVCLAVAGAGCASKGKRHRKQTSKTSKRHKEEVLLPRQTGSNLDRRITVDDESSLKKTKKKQRESKPPSKKSVKTEPTESEPAEPKKPEKPAETTPPPDRFR